MDELFIVLRILRTKKRVLLFLFSPVTDKDGLIGPDDFAVQMARMGDPVFPEQLQAFYHWFDEVGDGQVDFPMWLQQCLRLCVCGVANQALENKAKAKAAAKYDFISSVVLSIAFFR